MAGADLFEVLGAPSADQARRIVALLGLTPPQGVAVQRAQPPAEQADEAA